jgi:hypothetical protein
MNNKSETNNKPAYIKYSNTFGNILEVALHNKLNINNDESILEINRNIALDFLQGKKKIDSYIVFISIDGIIKLIEKEINSEIESFWELTNINNKNSPLKLLSVANTQFTVSLHNYIDTNNVILYITEKNDPNILYYTIKLNEYILNNDKIWTIPINLDTEYSIYITSNGD